MKNKSSILPTIRASKRVGSTTRRRPTLELEGSHLLESRQLLATLANLSETFSATVPVQTTDYTIPITLPKFDPSLGTLTEVDLSFSSSGNVGGTLTNVSSGPESFSFEEDINMSLEDSTTTLIPTVLKGIQTFPSVTSQQTVSFGPFTPTDSNSFSYTSGSTFDEFGDGPGNVNLNVSTLTTQVTTGGGGNIRAVIQTTAGAVATVTYKYTAVPVTLAGNVYEDVNGTGALAPGDNPIAGVLLTLEDSSGNIVATTDTAADGTYSFTTTSSGGPILPGTYEILETQPAGYLQGTNTVGTVNGLTDGALTGVDQIGSIVLTQGQNSVSNNFGEVLPVSVSGNVYEDVNGTGALAFGDNPIAGVTLTLFNSSGNVVATTMTAPNGTYSFTSTTAGLPLAPGTYTVFETQPTGYLQGTNTVGTVNGTTDGALTGLDQIGSIVLTSNQNSIDNNFGEVLPVTLSGLVYVDINHAGVFQPGDPPIAGVTINLYGAGGLVATTTTNAEGAYEFTDSSSGAPLAPGTYTIVESQPAGYAQGATTPGTVNGATVGQVPVGDIIASIGLKSNQNTISNNFGEVLFTPLTITNVQRFGVHNQPTLIVLTFNEPLNPATAQDVFNYHIAGPTDSRHPTSIPIESAHYDPASETVTLILGQRLQVHHPYTLTVTGLTSSQGVPLSATNGIPGEPYVTSLNRSDLSGFVDIYGNFVPIDHGKLYPAAIAAGYKHKKYVEPANLGSFASQNQATFQVATSGATPSSLSRILSKSSVKKLKSLSVIKL